MTFEKAIFIKCKLLGMEKQIQMLVSTVVLCFSDFKRWKKTKLACKQETINKYCDNILSDYCLV